MLTFAEFPYSRPNLEQLSIEFRQLLNRFNQAPSGATQNRIIQELNLRRQDYESLATLARIRHSIDTTDPYYERENIYFDETTPTYEALIHEYYRCLLESPYRAELEAKWGEQLFRLAALQLKTFSPAVIPDLQTENKLASAYRKLRASAQIQFQGEKHNLAQMEPFLQAKTRSVRQEAQEAYTGFFREYEAEFDRIYDQLVKVRDRIAKKLGFANFIELGYARLGRSDYNETMVAGYREQVLATLVPLATQLRTRQAKRLGLDTLKYYDEPLAFRSGNAVPAGDVSTILQQSLNMFQELSPETGAFFSFMVEKNLLDLVAKAGKAGGGYCAYISKHRAPFIFANFNGTSGDIDTLTHEAGHAFQVYCSREFEAPEYLWPTLEACEIHSLSMEFLTWPWMELFFGADTEKYKFAHLTSALLFVPYGVTVDEFQHWVYAQPTASPAARKQAWRTIERKYLPHRDYAGNNLLEQGGYWFRQGHIYTDPFYYIDYTLAQICAFQFWIKAQQNPREAWADYLHLCRAGGSRSFLELVTLAGLQNPFTAGSIAALLGPLTTWLDGVNDRQW
jgi:M3 family oligoendopeptidase